MNRYIRGIMPDPNHRRILLAIISVLSVYGLTVGFFYPLISLKMEFRGYPPSWIGVMGALPFLASIIFSPLIPLMMRRFNVTRLVFISICSDLLFITLMMLFDNVFVWFVCRFAMGIAGTILFVVSETWINEIAEDRYRGRVLGLYTFVFSATLGASPLFIVFFGAEGNLPFMLAIVVITFALIPLYWTRESNPDFSGGTVSHVWQFFLLAPTLVAAGTLMAYEESALITLLPVYALQHGLPESNAALLLTILAIGSMAAQPLVGRLADSMNRYVLLIICGLLILAGALALPLMINTKVWIWILMLIWGGAIAAIYTVALTIMGARFRGAQLAAGNAAFGLIWGVAGTVSPGMAGFGMTIWGSSGYIGVLVFAAVVFLAVAIYRRKHTT